MSVDEQIETLASAGQYEEDYLDDMQGASYTVARRIPAYDKAKNWMSSQFNHRPTATPRIETEDRVYQPELAKQYDVPKYGHATFEPKDTKPPQAHFSRSMGATPSPYNVNGIILGATTWSIDHDSHLATPDGSFMFQSGLEEAAKQWKTPVETVRNQYEQSIQRKLTPVTEKATATKDTSNETYSQDTSYQTPPTGNTPVNLSGLRIV
jgi:hypothetical protein